MKLSKLAAVVSLALVLVACEPIKPERTEVATTGVTVNLIVTIEGCNVYGIDRGGMSRWVYTTICPADSGKSASTSYTQDCGKNCTRNVEVPTVTTQSQLGGQVEKPYNDRLVK